MHCQTLMIQSGKYGTRFQFLDEDITGNPLKFFPYRKNLHHFIWLVQLRSSQPSWCWLWQEFWWHLQWTNQSGTRIPFWDDKSGKSEILPFHKAIFKVARDSLTSNQRVPRLPLVTVSVTFIKITFLCTTRLWWFKVANMALNSHSRTNISQISPWISSLSQSNLQR